MEVPPLNEWLPIEDFSNETLVLVAQRLEQSTTPRQFIAREAEMDDLWRFVEASIDRGLREGAEPRAINGLRRLFDAIAEAHDMTGEGRTVEAAARLRLALTPDPSETH